MLPDMPTPPPRDHLLDACLQDLRGWWLGVRCEPPRCHRVAYLPFKLLSRTRGRSRLRDILPKLKCEGCGGRPAHVWVVDHPHESDDPSQLSGAQATWSVQLVP